ncbi:MAG: hypothetical protein RLZZ350_2369 [Verrucomicrobiota bacterium]|jgi:4-hydroxythreonine-4-phosphate dehydrogenase
MNSHISPPLGLATGDPTGIGPEISLQALAARKRTDATRYILLGDFRQLQQLNEQLRLKLPLEKFSGWASRKKLQVIQPWAAALPEKISQGSPAAARAAMAALELGAKLCLQKKLSALVTAPVNKAAIIRSGQKNFVGQTEFLSQLARTRRTAMMLLGCDDRGRWLRVALATTHVPIRRVAQSLTAQNIRLAITLAAQACRDLGLPRAHVGVCGLNPHAGEDGKIGTEEIKLIAPVCRALKKTGVDLVGPLAADTLFYQAFRGDFDAVVAMYHDQGLAPLKMIGFEQGINWTLGLPFVRTSPDHGTAYDIAGRGVASPSSMIAALNLARRLAAQA